MTDKRDVIISVTDIHDVIIFVTGINDVIISLNNRIIVKTTMVFRLLPVITALRYLKEVNKVLGNFDNFKIKPGVEHKLV